MLTFRTATHADLDRIVEIHSLAFPDPRGEEARRRNFLAKPFGPFSALEVALLDGDLVAHAFGFALRAFVGGASVPITGVATVGVAPEARGRGIGASLVRHVEEVGRARGDVCSVLYPFRQGFYSRLGYVGAPHLLHLSVSPSSLPRERSAGLRVRRATGADRAVLEALYLAQAARSTGMIERPAALWNAHFSDERRSYFLAEASGAPLGYVSTLTLQSAAHGETRSELLDLVGATFSHRAALLGWLSCLRDQVAEIDLSVASDDPILCLLEDADRRRTGSERVEHPIGVVASGPMLRLGDPEVALAARGYRADGAFELELEGRTTGLGLTVQGGRAVVSAPRGGHPLAFTRRGAAAVLFGGLSVSHAASLGWVRGEDAALSAAARVLEVPAWHTWDAF